MVIDRILVPRGRPGSVLTPEPAAGHDERLMQRFFGDWYFSFGHCPE
jgi:hypothetical protein